MRTIQRTDELAISRDSIAQEFATTLRTSGISPGYVHMLDATHLVMSGSSYHAVTSESLGREQVESLHGRVISVMRNGGYA